MSTPTTSPATKAFCSYSHEDNLSRETLLRYLAPLQRGGLLTVWSDKHITAGQHISREIDNNIEAAEIFVFLISSHFLSSNACMKEWRIAKSLAQENPRIRRIPIILSRCAWPTLLETDDVLALPDDANPVSSFSQEDEPWQMIYNGIYRAIQQIHSDFSPKDAFRAKLESTVFVSDNRKTLSNTFVFPLVSHHRPQSSSQPSAERIIEKSQELLKYNKLMVYGDEMSGKTALARHLCLRLISDSMPVLLVDLTEIGRTVNKRRFQRFFSEQMHGDYHLWNQLNNKTVIFDNLGSSSHMLQLIELSEEVFERVIVFSRTDVFLSYYKDEERLAQFDQFSIGTLNYDNQEQLIRKWMSSNGSGRGPNDGAVDRAEDLVNSVIISNKIVPRYPFYVLSIMQTQEKFMPSELDITSYGHCYYALIVANLVKAGISKSGGALESCFNFSEHLAFQVFSNRSGGEIDLQGFVAEYRKDYLITDATINRLCGDEYGIITPNGKFRTSFMYLFFLGRYLARNMKRNGKVISEICKRLHTGENDKILLFLIHHSNDERVIEDVLLDTMCTMDEVKPATLSPDECRHFFEIVQQLKIGLVHHSQVPDERRTERRLKSQVQSNFDKGKGTRADGMNGSEENPESLNERGQEIYRVLKSNEVLGQVLRNKFGSLKRDRIAEIIETIADSGLRMINLALREKGIEEKSEMLADKFPEITKEELQRMMSWGAFLWTMSNLELVVHCTNVPEVREAMEEVVLSGDTPAYDLIGYFSLLDGSEEITKAVRVELARLWKKHNDVFIRQVLLLRTLNYMNTHRSRVSEEQAACSILGVQYRPRQKRLEMGNRRKGKRKRGSGRAGS